MKQHVDRRRDLGYLLIVSITLGTLAIPPKASMRRSYTRGVIQLDEVLRMLVKYTDDVVGESRVRGEAGLSLPIAELEKHDRIESHTFQDGNSKNKNTRSLLVIVAVLSSISQMYHNIFPYR